jgi:hypothetical protein
VTAWTAPPPLSVRSKPKTSLACLVDLEPDNADITSACSCFSSGYSIAPVTSTITAQPGPSCPGRQPTFPNCFADFHPYNCGTDEWGVVACSCARTTEDTAECTLGDYERDNACVTSDDCAEGWFCTNIECFGEGVDSVCTKACPDRFPVEEPGNEDGWWWDAEGGQQVQGAKAGKLLARPSAARNLSIVVRGGRSSDGTPGKVWHLY